MHELIIIGAGGHGKVAAEIAMQTGYRTVSFVDRDWPLRDTIGQWGIIAKEPRQTDAPHFCAIGDNTIRARFFTTASLFESPILQHPSAIISPSAQIGSGTLIVAGSIVNADAHIGAGVILNTASSVDHDCTLGDFVHISPGARLAGNVRVGARSWIGIGAVIREGVTIGEDALIAAGAVVIDDVADGQCVMGIPASVSR